MRSESSRDARRDRRPAVEFPVRLRQRRTASADYRRHRRSRPRRSTRLADFAGELIRPAGSDEGNVYAIEIELTSIDEVEGSVRQSRRRSSSPRSRAARAPSSPRTTCSARFQSWAANSRLAKGVVKIVQTAADQLLALYRSFARSAGARAAMSVEQTAQPSSTRRAACDHAFADRKSDVPKYFSKLFAYFRSSTRRRSTWSSRGWPWAFPRTNGFSTRPARSRDRA